MSERGRNTAQWAAIFLTAAAMAGGLALFMARSAAATEVRPVESRVSRLEAQRVEDAKDLDEIKGDVKELLRRTNR